MAFWDFLNNTKRYVGNIYEGAKRVGNVLGTFGKVGYNIGRGIFTIDYIADNQFNPQNYYFTKNEPIRPETLVHCGSATSAWMVSRRLCPHHAATCRAWSQLRVCALMALGVLSAQDLWPTMALNCLCTRSMVGSCC